MSIESTLIYGTNISQDVLKLALAASILEDNLALSTDEAQRWKNDTLFGATEGDTVLSVIFLRYEGFQMASYVSEEDENQVVIQCEEGTPEESITHFYDLIVKKAKLNTVFTTDILLNAARALNETVAASNLFFNRTWVH